MRYLNVNLACRGNDKPFDFGYTGENIVTGVIFDYSRWRELYGVGALTLAVQPSGISNPYPVTLTAIDDTHALWTLTTTDLNEEGAGRCQLTYVVGEAIKKSAVFVYKAGYSMDATGEIPDPYISYFEQILETGAQVQADAAAAEQAKEDAETAAQDARASADEIENMTATAETLPAGSDATAEYSDGTLSLGIPQGVPGNEGPQGPPGPTGNGIQSTVLNADYTLTITFTNGEHYTTPSIRGPQGPDGETGPTGKGIKSTVLNSDYTLTITFTDDTTYTTPSIRGEQGEQGEPGVVQDVTVNGTSVLDGAVAKVVIPQITKTVTGNPIVLDDADGEVKALNVELTPIQDGTGTPSPTNVRPIYPHTSLDVRDTGKNLWGGLQMAQDIQSAIPQAVLDTTEKTISYLSGYVTDTPFTEGITFKANTQYTLILRFSNTKARTNMRVLYTDGTTQFIPTLITGLQTVVFTTTANKTVDYVYGLNSDGTSVFYYDECGLFEGILTASDYAPYTGQTVTVPLNDLYGGNVDVINGQDGEETLGEIDLSTLTFIRSSAATADGSTCYYATVNGMATDTTNTGMYSDRYSLASGIYISTMRDGTMIRGSGRIYIATTSDTIQGQLVYPLATPTPLTTDPTALTLYKGDNVVSSDGDMELTYVRNLQAVITSIEDRLSALES